MTPSMQDTFRAALLDAERPVPHGLTDGYGRPAGRRFAVYRNNVASSLRDALAAGFPAVEKLIGPANFAHVAGLFLRQQPPSSPIMQRYGAGFAEFLEQFEPARAIGYLPDVARLEQAQRSSYHAADAAPIKPAQLQDLDEDELLAARFDIAPALRVLSSPWPILSIYRFTMLPDQPKPPAQAEDVLICRPLHDPVLQVLPAGGAAFVQALRRNQSFGAALKLAGADFDLPRTLGLLLEGGALCAILPGKDTQ